MNLPEMVVFLDEGRGTSDDFIRLGLQKLINEHVHKDSAMSRKRASVHAAPTLPAGNSWNGSSGFPARQDSTASFADPNIGDALASPMLVQIAGQKLAFGDAVSASGAAHRPKTTTALLEKLLSEESG